MISSRYRFSLDTHIIQSQVSIPVSLGDTARVLFISLTDAGKPFTIVDGCIAKLSIKRPTGTYLEEFCIIKKNSIIKYDFSQNTNTAAVEGLHNCEVTLYSPNGKILTSPKFSMVVSKRAVSSDDINLTDDDLKIIDSMVVAEAARIASENARVEAENEREGVAEQARELTEAAAKILKNGTNGVYPSEGKNSLIQGLSNNKAISESSSAWGKDNLAGLKGFRIIERTDNGDGTGTYTLDGYTGGYAPRVVKNFYDNEILDNSPNTEYKYRKLKIDLENGKYAWSLPENNFTGSGLYVLFTDDIAYEGSGTSQGCFTSWIGHDSVETLNHTSDTFTVTKGYVYLAFAGNKLPNLKGLLAPMRIDSVPETVAEAGDVYSIRYEYIWERQGEILKIDGNKVTVSNYVTSQMEYLGDNTEDRNCFWVVDKPTVGNLDIGKWTAAFGYKCKAIGKGSFAAGVGSEATGSYSVATGKGCEAIGYASNATGRDTVAKGQQSNATGWQTTASGEASHSEGYKTIALGKNSHSEGESTEASGQGSHAEGSGAKAQSFASHAEGWKSEANYTAAHAEGEQAVASGEASHAEGIKTNATMTAAHAEGKETQATSYSAHAEGYKAKAAGANAHAEGESTEASGIDSHAEGKGTRATAPYAHSEGESSVASAQSSHAEGYNSAASGAKAHAEGNGTTASGSDSHAEGQYTTASGQSSHAEGTSTEASQPYSHAEGYMTKAHGKGTHAEGCGTWASYWEPYQSVQGRFNKETYGTAKEQKYAHVIGNGTSEEKRSNALMVEWNGNVHTAGDYFQFDSSGNVYRDRDVVTGEAYRSGASFDLSNLPISHPSLIIVSGYKEENDGRYFLLEFIDLVHMVCSYAHHITKETEFVSTTQYLDTINATVTTDKSTGMSSVSITNMRRPWGSSGGLNVNYTIIGQGGK